MLFVKEENKFLLLFIVLFIVYLEERDGGEESVIIIWGLFFKVGYLNERDMKKFFWGDGGERVVFKVIYVLFCI